MRDRLIKLFKNFHFKCIEPCKKQIRQSENKIIVNCERCRNEQIADYLLENGVIVPPCKVGEYVYNLMECSCENIDGVYTVCEFYDEGMCACKTICPHLYRIEKCFVTDSNLLIFTKKWGKTAFLTKEEAEQALKERSNK